MDDYSRMAWMTFLKTKLESFELFKIFKKEVENEIDLKIKCLRLDHGGELELFCEDHKIMRQYSTPITPQQNGVVERKNRTMLEMVKDMLSDSRTNDMFWTKVVSTSIHIQSIGFLIFNTRKTPYEL